VGEEAKIKRILVRAPNWVGDAVMSLPALHRLRQIFSMAEITVAAVPGSADVFAAVDFIDNVLIHRHTGASATIRHAREWRARELDLAILFQNAFGAAATAFLARIQRRIGYATDRRGSLLTHPLSLPDWKDERHESFYYLNIVSETERIILGASSWNDVPPDFTLEISEERKRGARELLQRHGVLLDRPLAILCPGSVNSRAKRWAAESYAALSDRLNEQGFDVALIGSPGELEVSEQVTRQTARRPILLTGKTRVAEAMAIISLARILITNDTGPAHIGAALQTPTLVIFGPTNPLTTYPLSPAAKIIRRPPDCAPCMLRDCPIDHRCMTAISPEEVFRQAMSLISEKKIQIVG
jgi:heptosyltransferase-2